ncbi:hypothetical protein IPJ91_02045 [bacterium]|nr:MAG: hypothetical protein IPJ91_02045 [bacterium]
METKQQEKTNFDESIFRNDRGWIVLFAIIVVMMFLMFFFGNKKSDSMILVNNAISSMNADLPKSTDNNGVTVTVKEAKLIKQDTLQIVTVIQSNGVDIKRETLESNKELLAKTVKLDTNLVSIRDKDMNVEYRYEDENGNELATVLIKKEDYR